MRRGPVARDRRAGSRAATGGHRRRGRCRIRSSVSVIRSSASSIGRSRAIASLTVNTINCSTHGAIGVVGPGSSRGSKPGRAFEEPPAQRVEAPVGLTQYRLETAESLHSPPPFPITGTRVQPMALLSRLPALLRADTSCEPPGDSLPPRRAILQTMVMGQCWVLQRTMPPSLAKGG